MRLVQRNALFALLAVALAAAAFALAPSAATTTTNIAYTDESGSLYLASTAAAGTTTLYTNDDSGSVQALAFTPDGKNVLVATPDTGGLALVATGGGTPVAISGTEDATSGSLSPDGQTVLFATSDGIYTVPLAGGTATQVLATPDGDSDSLPVYSPSGKQIAFARVSFDADDNETVTLELFTVAGATTTDLATDLLTDLGDGGRIAFAPNGKTIVYAGGYDNTGVFTVPVAGGTATRLTTDQDLWPSFSPDGTTIFFSRDAYSPGADDQAPTPVSSSSNDVDELWSIATSGDSPAVIQEGDYETLVVASKSTSGATTTTGSTTRSTTTGSTTTGSTTTTTTTTTKSATPASAHSIGLSVTGHHYKVTWSGTAADWKATLRVGKKTSTVTVKGSVHSHVFTVTAKGAVSVSVTATASTATTTTEAVYSDGNGSVWVTGTTAAAPTSLYDQTNGFGFAAQDISPNGATALLFDQGNGRLAHVSISGGTPTAVTGTNDATSGTYSPDGSAIVFSTDQGVFTVTSGGGVAKQIVATPDGDTDTVPTYSPSGRQIAFVRDATDDEGNETTSIEVVAATGGTPKALGGDPYSDPGGGARLSYAPNGKTIAYSGNDDNPGIFTIPATGGTATQLTTDTDLWPTYSPDGSTIYFSRNAFSADADDEQPSPVSPSDDDLDELWSMSAAGASAAVIQEGDFEHVSLGTAKSGTTTSTPGNVTTISVSVSGHRYTVSWKGTAAGWKVTLRVGKKTSTATVKGSARSHLFTVTAKGAVSVTVTAT